VIVLEPQKVATKCMMFNILINCAVVTVHCMKILIDLHSADEFLGRY